jgi:DNA-binding XRE family transcriptional regulator
VENPRPLLRNTRRPLVHSRPTEPEFATYSGLGPEMLDNIAFEHGAGVYPMRYGRVNDGIRGTDASLPHMESMGDRIKQLREAKGFTQAELARRLDVGRAAVNKWENGETANIENATFLLLCVELGTDPPYLVWGPDRWPEKRPPAPEDTGSSGRFRIGGKRRS